MLARQRPAVWTVAEWSLNNNNKKKQQNVSSQNIGKKENEDSTTISVQRPNALFWTM